MIAFVKHFISLAPDICKISTILEAVHSGNQNFWTVFSKYGDVLHPNRSLISIVKQKFLKCLLLR